MSDTYRIVRLYRSAQIRRRTLHTGLTLDEAQAHCKSPETSSTTCTDATGRRRTRQLGAWFDAYEGE